MRPIKSFEVSGLVTTIQQILEVHFVNKDIKNIIGKVAEP